MQLGSTPTYVVEIGGITAEYYVSNCKERWRATSLMGEDDIVRQFVGSVHAGDVVWDIGAAVGTYSVLAARAGARVVAVEPVASNYQRLTENATLNEISEMVDVHTVALSDNVGSAPLRLSGQQVGEGTHRIADSGELMVPTLPGDVVDAPEPDVVKVDVEGHEKAVLRGLQQGLEDARVVFVEVHHQHDVTVDEIKDLLRPRGFDVGALESGRSETYLLGAD